MAASSLGTVLVSPPEPTQEKKGRFYQPELDALRLLAFILVFSRHVLAGLHVALDRLARTATISGSILLHTPQVGSAAVAHSSAWPAPQEFLQILDFGVCLFFFLSSYLITKLLLIEHGRTGSVNVGSFYMRRGLRIWPLYFFFIALCCVIGIWVPTARSGSGTVLATIFFVVNWVVVLHGWEGTAILPLWSICAEEQFYLIWPAFARYGRKAIIRISVILCVASVATIIYLGVRGGRVNTKLWPNSLVQGLFFSGGALAAVVRKELKFGSATRLALGAAGLACWLIAAGFCHILRIQTPGPLPLVAGFLITLAGTWMIFEAWYGLPAKLFPAWVIYLGKISYGLYVYHLLCLILVHALMDPWSLFRGHVRLLHAVAAFVALIATVIVAHYSYTLLEMPFLRLKERFTVVRSRPE